MSGTTDGNRIARMTGRAFLAVALTAGALALAACSSGGRGKIVDELQRLPEGLLSDQAHARHTEESLRGDR